MKFSVDAHAIGLHLTGNEVYIRNLLHAFAGIDSTSEFITYMSVDTPSPWDPLDLAIPIDLEMDIFTILNEV